MVVKVSLKDEKISLYSVLQDELCNVSMNELCMYVCMNYNIYLN